MMDETKGGRNMKRIGVLLLALCLPVLAQQNPLVVQQQFSAAGTSNGFSTAGYTNHTITFSPATNTATTGCTVQIDSGPTATGPWTAGGLITSTACNAAVGTGGTATVTSTTASFARINVTAISTGTIKVTYSAVNAAVSKSGVSTAAGVVALFTACSGTQYLGADGACHNAGGSGTVTSVTGTANQVDVATGTTTPVISLDAAINLPGTINKLTLTAPATGATLTLADGTTLNDGPGGTLTSIAFTTPGTGVVTALGNTLNAASGLVGFSGALGTPTSGVVTNLTGTGGFNTSGSAASMSIAAQTGLLTFTGLASTNRIKTVRDAADTILELGGSYTPTGTWTNLTLVTPALGTPASGVITNLTGACTNCNANNSAQVNTNTYPAAAGFTSGGIPYFSSTTAEGSSALLAANGVVLGGGSGTAPATNTSLTFSAGTLNVGTTGTTGTININGTTAGVAAPITTLASGLTLVFPTGTSTNPGQNYVSNNSNSGWVGNGTGGVNWSSSGSATALIGANGFSVSNAGTFGFNRTGARELGIGDESAATGGVVMSVDSGTIGNEGGLLRDANVCRITADVSLTVNVANSFCSFSVGGTARGWGVVCNLLWTISAGTGTNTFALGVNPSQTPTGTTNVGATILTTQTGTQTQGTAAVSASGANTILTSPTYTPAATIQYAQVYGTVLTSATAGTLAVTATANGTTATAAIKAGSQCTLN
jgi:hypothetical protein